MEMKKMEIKRMEIKKIEKKMTPRDLFEILEDLVKKNGFNAVKDTVDSMWTLLEHLDGENEFVEGIRRKK